MGTFRHCTGSPAQRGAGARNTGLLLALLLVVFAVHGFHPWAEDGGLYAANIEYDLNRQLFPTDTAFARVPSGYSCFPRLLAAVCAGTRLPLQQVLLLGYTLSALLMLIAVQRLARAMFASTRAADFAIALLAAAWALPVAGTSLLVMDPYLTARSFAVPCTLLALAQVAELEQTGAGGNWLRPFPSLRMFPVLATLAIAGLFHPLMAAYGGLLIALVLFAGRRRPAWQWAVPLLACIALAATVQWQARPETPAGAAAALSRTYWFLAGWHWYELVGLAAPPVLLWLCPRLIPRAFTPAGLACSRAALAACLCALCVATGFARHPTTRDAVARFQPLRVFLYGYVLLIAVLGGLLGTWALAKVSTASRSWLQWRLVAAVAVLAGTATAMYLGERRTYSASAHLELRSAQTAVNSWARAFSWIRLETPAAAVFALPAHYVDAAGEDAQGFRAIAQRSALPDYSKDGGEAAIQPSLAVAWFRAVVATTDLDRLSDAERIARVQPLGATWMVLDAAAVTRLWCPYRNEAAQVCKLPATPGQTASQAAGHFKAHPAGGAGPAFGAWRAAKPRCRHTTTAPLP